MGKSRFKVGDRVTDGQFNMKVLAVMQDEDKSWWYECAPINFKFVVPFNREIPERRLSALVQEV